MSNYRIEIVGEGVILESCADDVVNVVLEETPVNVTLACEQGPAGPPGPQGPPGTGNGIPRIDVSGLAPSFPLVVDTVDGDAESVKWLVTVIDGTSRGYKEVTATRQGTTPDVVIGPAIRNVPFDASVNFNAGNYELEVEHNQAGSVDVVVLRIAVEASP